MLIDFLCDYVSEELSRTSDILDAAFVLPQALPSYDLPKATAALTHKCLKKSRPRGMIAFAY